MKKVKIYETPLNSAVAWISLPESAQCLPLSTVCTCISSTYVPYATEHTLYEWTSCYHGADRLPMHRPVSDVIRKARNSSSKDEICGDLRMKITGESFVLEKSKKEMPSSDTRKTSCFLTFAQGTIGSVEATILKIDTPRLSTSAIDIGAQSEMVSSHQGVKGISLGGKSKHASKDALIRICVSENVR